MKIKILWVNGFIFFVIGDLVTTLYGIGVLGAIEENYIPNILLQNYGLWIFIPLKLIHFFIIYIIYKILPYPYNLPAPILLNIFGIWVTITNILVILKL